MAIQTIERLQDGGIQDMEIETIVLCDFSRSRRQVTASFAADELQFTISHWYPDVNFYELEERYGFAYMEKIYFHLLIFDFSKLVSLCPKYIDLGPMSKFHTREFETLWDAIFKGSWAQWRYENNLPYYKGPVFLSNVGEGCPSDVLLEPIGPEVLNFVGGGKDSLVSLSLLDKARIPFATYGCSHSKIGRSEVQHRLIEAVNTHFGPSRHHRHYAYDDFLDSPVLRGTPRGNTLEFPETIMSIFQALPILLMYGYRFMVLGNERSADVGNLNWTQTGEEVNHQWAKTLEAERLFTDYIQSELISNAAYFSVLRPVYDTLIFSIASGYEEAMLDTSSCNIEKPWCYECPKCAYIWLSLMAHLQTSTVDQLFGNRNLADLEANQLSFRQLLGLEKHIPFECVGQVPESRLAFEICRRKGLQGEAFNRNAGQLPGLDVESVLQEYLSIDLKNHTIPAKFAEAIFPVLREASDIARSRILSLTGRTQ